ncbi:MAG TPA: FAD-dependent oxidoreductase [Actinomycetes bacterium]|jgi:thioredoxin reductase (NADPH)|nr:FAD-dependent oxidoreductase [Actinomycetes bacterium]
MGPPILFLVNDDGRVLEALDGDLARRFGADHRILGQTSPGAALATLRQLADRSEEVALLVAAQRMDEMAGVEFLLRAHELHPTAKRVLLVGRRAWTSTNPAVRAMTLGQIDTYLFEPWLPAARWLYLPISQVLADWIPAHGPSFEGIRIVGPRLGTRSHDLRDLLTRMGIPHGWYQAGSAAGRRLLEEAGQDGSRLPVMVFHSGQVFVDPSNAELLEALGFGTRPAAGSYDLVIIGAGPAGLAAAVYAASEGLETLVVEPQVVGGQAGTSAMIRNYLGFPGGIGGGDLANRALEQAWLFGANIVLAQQATSLRPSGAGQVVHLSDGSAITARAVVVASGVAWRRLGVPRLESLVGAGVFYGAAGAEARALEGQHVFVVGAGNSAGQAAVHLAKHAASVTVLVRGAALGRTMSEYLVREIEEAPNIAVRLRTQVVDGLGRSRLEGLTLRNRDSGATQQVAAAALFVMIGGEPRTGWLTGVERDDRGYILTGHDLLGSGRLPSGWPHVRPPLLLETSIPGVFAAGDVRYRSVKRVASAVGEGAVAVQLVHQYLNGH